MKKKLEMLRVLGLAGMLLAVVSTCNGQETASTIQPESGQGSLAFLLEKQDTNAATGASLKAQLDTLNKQLSADPYAAQREEIRDHEAYVAELQPVRIHAQKMANPVVLPEYDLLIREAEDTTKFKKSELIVRQKAPNPERDALKTRVERIQKDLEWNSKVSKTLADHIKSVQDDHRYESLRVEIDTLFKNPANAGTEGSSVVDDLTLGKRK